MSAFLQPGNYFEAGISVLDPDVSGKEAGSSATRRDISDMGEDYFFPNAALNYNLTINSHLVYCTISHLVQMQNILGKMYLYQILLTQF